VKSSMISAEMPSCRAIKMCGSDMAFKVELMIWTPQMRQFESVFRD
jgi:hypothetical protein